MAKSQSKQAAGEDRGKASCKDEADNRKTVKVFISIQHGEIKFQFKIDCWECHSLRATCSSQDRQSRSVKKSTKDKLCMDIHVYI